MLGRPIREVTIDLYRRWLGDVPAAEASSPEQWLDDWVELGDRRLRDTPAGPTATEIMARDRERLEPRKRSDTSK